MKSLMKKVFTLQILNFGYKGENFLKLNLENSPRCQRYFLHQNSLNSECHQEPMFLRSPSTLRNPRFDETGGCLAWLTTNVSNVGNKFLIKL